MHVIFRADLCAYVEGLFGDLAIGVDDRKVEAIIVWDKLVFSEEVDVFGGSSGSAGGTGLLWHVEEVNLAI